MKNPAVLFISVLALAGCGSSGEEPPEGPLDTSYERQLPPPVSQADSAAEPVPDNTSITSGPDERVDAIVADEVNDTDDRAAGEFSAGESPVRGSADGEATGGGTGDR